MEASNDEILMIQVRDGDVDQLTLLFERYSGMLYSYFMKRTSEHALSEDLTQEVFLRVLKYRKTYNPQNPFKAWLFTIARNTQKKQWGKRFSKLHVLSENYDTETKYQAEDQSPLPDAETNRKQENELLYAALEKLAPEKQQLVILKRIQDLSYAEMAEKLDCDINPLKVRVHRAIAELAKHLKSLIKERPYELRRMQ